MTSISKIQSEKYYSASLIIKNGWFPWIKSIVTFMEMLKNEEKARDLYKPITREVGNQIRFQIKGQTVLDIIKLSEEGKLEI